MRDAIETEAIVLRVVDYAEADRICQLLTRDLGKRSVFAKRAKSSVKQFKGGINSFTLLRVRMRDKGPEKLATLVSSEVSVSWQDIGGDLERMALGSYLLELLDVLLQDGQGEGALFNTVSRFMMWLHGETGGAARVEAGGHRLQLMLLNDAGLLPPLRESVRSSLSLEHENEVYWLPNIGLVAASERLAGEHGAELSGTGLRYLYALVDGKFPSDAATVARREVRRALALVWTTTLGRELRSFPFYCSMFDPAG
ncbi:MAG: DNA repair protein RecO (recombination protein O) [Bradymonadia bacterium]